MRVRPPAAQVLVAEDPRLAGGAVRDGRAHLRGRRGRLVHRPGMTRSRRTGNPPPPGEFGLAGLGGVVGIRVRQGVARRHIHQDERIEGDPQTARLHLLDRLHHRKIGGRAAIDRAILIIAADQKGIGPADAIHGPDRHRRHGLGGDLDAGPHHAIACPQIVAEPGNDQRHAFDLRGHGLQAVQRHHHVGGVGQRVQVLGLRRPATALPDALRGIGELAGCRDHGDCLRETLRRVGISQWTEDFETQLRDAVAVVPERQVLENDIGRAAIGGRVCRAHLRRNERIGRLAFISRIPAPRDPGGVQQFSVGPDAANAGDWPLAERDRETGIVEVFGCLDLAATPATLRRGLGLLAKIRRPDDVAADPHAAIEAWDHRSFSGRGEAQIVEPRAFNALGGCE